MKYNGNGNPSDIDRWLAVAGIGSDNVIGVPVDRAARVDLDELDKKLKESLENERPVYAVVAIIGSTEGK